MINTNYGVFTVQTLPYRLYIFFKYVSPKKIISCVVQLFIEMNNEMPALSAKLFTGSKIYLKNTASGEKVQTKLTISEALENAPCAMASKGIHLMGRFSLSPRQW